MNQFLFKIQIISLLFIFFCNEGIFFENNKDIKVCLCTMGKSENLYAKEFIEYYIKLGFDHLFIYDNNSPNTEKLSQIVEEKYKNQVTIYETFKYNITNQPQAFTDCYLNNSFMFDWILMVDMDEFLYIVDNSLKNYLSNVIFKKCDFIQYYWVLPSDNNLIYYDSRPLFERFNGSFVKSNIFKTMVKGKISNLSYAVHSIKYHLDNKTFCNNEGNKISGEFIPNLDQKHININKAYIIHYRFKSTEEFVKKYKRGYNYWLGKRESQFLQELLDWYFWVNEITLEKINYIERELNVSLNSFRKRYKKEHNLTENRKFL